MLVVVVRDDWEWGSGRAGLGVPIVLGVALWSVEGIVHAWGTWRWVRGLPVWCDAIALCRLFAACERIWGWHGRSCVLGALEWLGSL